MQLQIPKRLKEQDLPFMHEAHLSDLKTIPTKYNQIVCMHIGAMKCTVIIKR